MTEQEFNEIRSRIDHELQPYIWSDEDEKAYNAALDAYYYKDCNDKEDVVLALKGLCDLISRKGKVIPRYEQITADKIFTDGRNISQMPVFDEQECTEYIRKDLLLGWAKEKKAELLDDEELTDVAAGINMGMDMLIHKINSL